MSPTDAQAPPPAGEEIHLPGPSLQPVLLSFGITLMLVGVTIGRPLLAAGLILSVWVIVRWVADTRREMAELPEDLSDH
ncbi:MAG: hypothetical protein M3401_08785 [Actinomycetota bacterium]|nr:hypothetical protein [Actinomycetota bacterium]